MSSLTDAGCVRLAPRILLFAVGLHFLRCTLGEQFRGIYKKMMQLFLLSAAAALRSSNSVGTRCNYAADNGVYLSTYGSLLQKNVVPTAAVTQLDRRCPNGGLYAARPCAKPPVRQGCRTLPELVDVGS